MHPLGKSSEKSRLIQSVFEGDPFSKLRGCRCETVLKLDSFTATFEIYQQYFRIWVTFRTDRSWTSREKFDILINQLRIVIYELLSLRLMFIAPVTSYKLLFVARVTGYLFHTSYELLFVEWVTNYLSQTSYKLLLIAGVMSYLLYTCYELLFIYEVRVTVYYTSYFFKSIFVTLSLTYL